MDPFGWRIVRRRRRRADGAGDVPARPPDHRLDRCSACVAGLLLSLDGLHFVLSRLALLDIFVAFFILCGVHCIVADRDWHRAKMARLTPGAGRRRPGVGPVRGLLFRPWLLLGRRLPGGSPAASKWEAVYPLAAFGLLVWLWSAGARRSFGVRWPVVKSVLVDGIPAFVHLVLVALVVYVATWTGWLIHAHQYEEHLSATQYTHYAGGHGLADRAPSRTPTASARSPSRCGRSGTTTRTSTTSTRTSSTTARTPTPRSRCGWLLLNRPVGVAADTGIQPGTQGCDAPAGSDCLRQVLLLGNPTIWWGGCLALVFAAGDVGRRPRLALRRRHRRRALHLAALAAVRRPTDLLVLRDRHAAVPGARADPGDRAADRPVDRAQPHGARSA